MLKWKSIKLVGQTQEQKAHPKQCLPEQLLSHSQSATRIPTTPATRLRVSSVSNGRETNITSAPVSGRILAPAAPIQRRPLCAEVSPQSRPPWRVENRGYRLSLRESKKTLPAGFMFHQKVQFELNPFRLGNDIQAEILPCWMHHAMISNQLKLGPFRLGGNSLPKSLPHIGYFYWLSCEIKYWVRGFCWLGRILP